VADDKEREDRIGKEAKDDSRDRYRRIKALCPIH